MIEITPYSRLLSHGAVHPMGKLLYDGQAVKWLKLHCELRYSLFGEP